MAKAHTPQPTSAPHAPGGSDQDERAAWISVHLFHRGNLDHLITGAVAPLVEDLTGSGALGGYFFLRYWEGGPHLRLRLLPTSPSHAEQVRSTLIQRATRYLTDHPSPPAPAHAAEAYQALAQRLAHAERLTDHDRALHPDDTVEFIPYQPEYAAYGQRPALTAVEAHFTESSTIALHLLTAGIPPARRHAAALAMLMLTLAVCEPDLARATSRLRSAPAGGIQPAMAANPGARSLQDSDRHTREALRDQACDLWARTHGTCQTPLGAPLAAWLHSMRTLHAQLNTARAQGRFAPTDCLSPLAHLAQAACPQALSVSQVLLRCTHLLCNRLGIHAAAEAQIAHLLTRTLTDLDQER
jgi:thiopeptide-type bacteriocin biosynthesis protein